MRKYSVVLSAFTLIFFLFLTACGGGSKPVAVSLTSSSSSTTMPAGSSAVTLTATVSNDTKNGGNTWAALTPATGCGTLSTTTTTATYTPPAAATLNADCTATVTAISASDTTKTATVALTIKAITVTVTSSAGTTTIFGTGAPAVTLTATLNNEASGATDTVVWTLTYTGGTVPTISRASHPNTAMAPGCGTLTSSGNVATYTPPSSLGSNCTATITAASTINSHQTLVTTFTINVVVVAITSPTSAVTEFAHQGNIALTASITNDAASKGLFWSLSNSACGAVAAGSPTTSATYIPPAAPAAACSTYVIATSLTDPLIYATSPLITINPNIVVAWSGNPPTGADEGATAALAATITNDVGGKGLSWTVSPATGCGTLSATTGTNVTYTAPSPLASACTATVTVSSVADSSASAQTAIAVTPTAVSITAPTGAQSVASSAVVAFTATIANDGSGKGIVWTISPATGCGTLSATAGAAINYTAPTEANLPTACTATVSAAPMDDPTKTKSVAITANPITVSAITSTSGTLPLTVGQGSVAIPLTATINFDTGGGINWSRNVGGGGLLGTATQTGSTATSSTWTINFTPSTTVGAVSTVTISAASVADPTKVSTATIIVTPLTVTITTPATNPTNVADGATQALVATVVGDPANKGVAWSLNPATGCGSLTVPAAPTFTATYNAPAAGTAACTVAVMATSVADNTKSTTTTINASPGISVGLSPAGTLSIDANNPLSITATVAGDSASKGVNLSLNPATGCGTLSATSANSGVAFSYNPPAALASTCTVSVVAVSQSDGTRTATLGLTVYPALTLPATSTTSLGTATVGAQYAGYLNATGGPGSGNYTWTVSGLSNGLTSDASIHFGNTLTISGMPTAATPVTFTASVQDSTGTKVGPVTYTITVNAYTAVSLPTNPLPPATVGQTNYNAGINAIGGIQTYAFTVNGTPIPTTNAQTAIGTTGLIATSSGGNSLILSGAPVGTAGTQITLNVGVVDGEGKAASATYTINVSPVSTIVISASDLEIPQGMATMPYSMNVTWNNAVSGGTQPYTISYTGLPSWATADPSGNGNVTGSLPTAGSTTVTVTVKDSSSPQQQTSSSFVLPVVALTTGANNSLLSGQYACFVHEVHDTPISVNGYNLYMGAAAFAFTSAGNGNITGGELDTNTPGSGYTSAATNGNITGTYAVGGDNRGYIILNGGGTNHVIPWALAAGIKDSNGYYSEFRFAEMGDAGATPSGKNGGGLCFKQYYQTGTTTLNGQTMSGGYVFGMNGEDRQGTQETMLGSIKVSSGVVTGVMDTVDGTQATLNLAISGTATAADSYGRVVVTAGPTGQNANSSVIYITNQVQGEGVIMATNPHNAGSNSDLWWGQIRKQNATHIAAAYPITGPFVLYASGLGTGGPQDYKVMLGHGSGGSSATSLNIDASLQNDTGTVSSKGPGPLSYTVDPATGRTTLNSSGGNTVGDVFYLYDTNEAILLFGDVGNSGSTPQNMLGWLETQVVPNPNSGPWAFSNISANYFMGDMYSMDTSGGHHSTGRFSVDGSGNLTNFAQDEGNQNWADWAEGLSGQNGVTATGVLAPDVTLDPDGTLGIFDINMTQGGKTATQVYCFVASVDHATNSLTRGAMICMDASSNSPKITIIRE